MPTSTRAGGFLGEVDEAIEPRENSPRRFSRATAVVGTLVVLVAASTATLVLIRHQGVGIGGDEPYYLLEAVSIGRFHTLNMIPAYQYAISHHTIYPWKVRPGIPLVVQIGQGIPRPEHGLFFSFHAIGMSVLLAVPMLINAHVALAVLVVILALLAVGLAHLVGELAHIDSSWRLAIAGLFLAPAYLLATTQIYPDLISGLVIAIVILLIALIERRGRCSPLQLVAGSSLLAFLPWLDAKNILLPAPIIVAIVVVYFRTKLPKKQFAWLVVPVVVSVVGAVSLNMWAFGHPLGPPAPFAPFGMNTLTRAVALLVDRRQGLFVQFPTALLGLAGIWVWRRRTPVAALSALVVVLATTYGNATQSISFGGGSFVGRFAWPNVPVLLAFGGLYLLELWKVRRRAVRTIGVLIGALYVLQAIPILRDEHQYFNVFAWDPARYTGWWGGLDPSPILGYIGSAPGFPIQVSNTLKASSLLPTSITGAIPGIDVFANSRTWLGLLFIVLGEATVVYLLVGPFERERRARRVMALCAVTASVVTGILTLSAPVPLPPPVSFEPLVLLSQVPAQGTSRVATGPKEHGAVVLGPYWSLLPGTYRATVNYRLVDRSRNVATVDVIVVTKTARAGFVTLTSRTLRNSSRSANIDFSVPTTETVLVGVYWGGKGSLEVGRLILAKTTSR
ncbi:MAG: hypothetical protein WAM97_09615 [Acidimicrobiales bacterium]